MKSKRRKQTFPTKAKLLFAIFSQSAELLEQAENLIQNKYGNIIAHSDVFEFSSTDYYKEEMGLKLLKKFLFVDSKIERMELVDVKLWAIQNEDQFLDENENRKINIDPMIMTEEQLLVSTGKLFPHRVYLGNGVFGQLELIRKKHHFEAMPWTYADYKEFIPFFEKCYDLKIN